MRADSSGEGSRVCLLPMAAMSVNPRLAWLDACLVPLLAVAGCFYAVGLERFLDLGFGDEPYYMNRGLSGHWPAEWAPLYGAWYAFLSLFEPRRIELYYLNQFVMSVLPALAMYLSARVLIRSVAASFLLAMLFLSSAPNFTGVLKVSQFALMIMLGGVALFAVCRKPYQRWLAGACVSLLASYVRPEMFLSFVAFAALFGLRLLYDLAARGHRRFNTKDVSLLAAAALGMALLLQHFGAPMDMRGGG